MIENYFTNKKFVHMCRSALRTWQFQVSKDGQTWTTLYDHKGDNKLVEPGLVFGGNLWACEITSIIVYCKLQNCNT